MHSESTQVPFHANEGGKPHKTGSKGCAEWGSKAILGPRLASGELLAFWSLKLGTIYYGPAGAGTVRRALSHPFQCCAQGM